MDRPEDSTEQLVPLEELLDGVTAVEGLASVAASGGALRLAVSGLAGASGSALLASAYRHRGGTWLVVAPDLATAEALCDDLETWNVASVSYLPELEILPFDRKSPTREIQASVQAGLDLLDRKIPGIFVTTIYGLRHKVMSRATLARGRRELAVGEEVDTEDFGEWLSMMGYRPGGVVEQPGDMALRGGLIDVYSPSHGLPLRIELIGDEIESIRTFDPTDQRSRDVLERATIIPAAPLLMDDDHLVDAMARVEAHAEVTEDDRTDLMERLQDRLHFAGLEGLAPFFHPQVTYLDYLDDDATLVWFDTEALNERNEDIESETTRMRAERVKRGDPVPDTHELIAPTADLARQAQAFSTIWTGDLIVSGGDGLGPPAKVKPVPAKVTAQAKGNGDVAALLEQSAALGEKGLQSILFCDNKGQADRLRELVSEQSADLAMQAPEIRLGSISRGFVWRGAQLAVFTDHELFDRYRRTSRRARFRGAGRIADPSALRSGDYCVHVDHGIGRFLGLRRITAEGVESECLLIEYAEKDRLYVPTDKLQLVERYELGEQDEPTLHKLGGGQWDRVKKRARKAIQVMAQELLTLYAARASLPGHAYEPDGHYQREMEDSFVHEETPDQLTSVAAIKADMEQSRPMDRLVCGDVGFGKTEVAMRAAFKAVMDGKQVAVLCPTTLLAEQHGETFSQRLRDYPVKVEVLSRFKSPAEQKETTARSTAGEVDILIGTHRLLSRDVGFKDLGLLIVDEEQRFGVRHKERLKEMRKQVDVLTLSATPIPRTLYLSLMGTRDMSIIATPPRDRLPIHTEVAAFDEALIAEAILREMHRGGQVFFVHNRVETIDAMAALVRKTVPEAKVCVAHGQMSEMQLEEIMRDFLENEYDVLVTTMIIESGLDMPNVNTIIIDRADRFGLSQLYQLRGRVGRSRHQAYAHLLVPTGLTLSPDARRRLAAIQEFTDLGSGYHVAMRDLEIRGAGNILGDTQHGHIAAIGFDLYCKLLEEEILALKGEGLPKLQDVKVDLRVSAFLPDEYVADPEAKLRWYRELGRVSDERQLDGLAAELRDRFGPPPPPVAALVDITRLKLRALLGGIDEIKGLRHGVRMVFAGDRQPDSTTLKQLVGTGKPRLTFNAVQRLEMTAEASRETWLSAALVVLERLASAVLEDTQNQRVKKSAR